MINNNRTDAESLLTKTKLSKFKNYSQVLLQI